MPWCGLNTNGLEQGPLAGSIGPPSSMKGCKFRDKWLTSSLGLHCMGLASWSNRWCSVFLEKLLVAQLVDKISVLCDTRRCVQRGPSLKCITVIINQFTLLRFILLTTILILYPHLCPDVSLSHWIWMSSHSNGLIMLAPPPHARLKTVADAVSKKLFLVQNLGDYIDSEKKNVYLINFSRWMFK
jgi:hypothetical protein